jgi:mono/diheme cytochrome c family protein
LFVVLATTGCWEQWSETWFPQMKWQKAVQAFERVEWNGQVEGFLAPEGSVPVNAAPPEYGRLDLDGLAELRNPTNPSNIDSIARGQELFRVYCTVCHGERGMGDGPVSEAGPKKGPFIGVGVIHAASTKSDGYIYNLIRIGRGGQFGYRMPSYKRIPDMDRWHLVNYVRHLQRGDQPLARTPSSAPGLSTSRP